MSLATLAGRFLCHPGLHDVAWTTDPDDPRHFPTCHGACRRDGCYWAVVRKGGRR